MVDIIQLQSTCLFCEPEAHNQASQVLLRSDNFFLFAGLGPIIEGYIILAPHRCDDPEKPFHSFSEIPPALLDEAIFMRGVISHFYRDVYHQTTSMHFEHGRAGVCYPRPAYDTKHCYHGHLCCYPSSIPLWEDMEDLDIQEIESLPGLKKAVDDFPYLLVERSTSDSQSSSRELWESRVAIIKPGDPRVPSQYLRKLLAARVGQAGMWDWGVNPQPEVVQKLIEDFHTWLPQIQMHYDLVPDADGRMRLNYLPSVERSNQIGNNSVAQKFHETWTGKLQYNAIGRFLSALPKREPDEDRPRILDIGCGPGHYLRAFAAAELECVGIDISGEMVDIARQVVAASHAPLQTDSPIPAPQVENVSLFDLAFDHESFEGIWYSAVVVHVPRRALPDNLRRLHQLLKRDGVLYMSAQIGSGSVFRREGRVFFYYREDELKEIFDHAGFEVHSQWRDETSETTTGGQFEKHWMHFLLKKKPPRPPVLSDLGERELLARIRTWIPKVEQDQVILDIGDDCAAIRPPQGEIMVVTTDPGPQPVISLLGERDRWYDGWFTMIVNLSDLGAMGATPLGMLLAIEAPNDMPVTDLERFYDGILAASQAFECPIIGGNVKDAPRFICVGTAFGSVAPQNMLRRDAARPGELVIVLGEMGLFWAGVLHKIESIPISSEESTRILEPLRKPRPRLVEGRSLAEQHLSRCAMDSSDGLTACFYEIARSGKGIDINLDFSAFVPDPLVGQIAAAARIDVRKLLLSWGNWELVATIDPRDLSIVQTLMADLGCPVQVVGSVTEGHGQVWLANNGEPQPLNYVASERFSKRSYFSHGLAGYLHILRDEPLTCKPQIFE